MNAAPQGGRDDILDFARQQLPAVLHVGEEISPGVAGQIRTVVDRVQEQPGHVFDGSDLWVLSEGGEVRLLDGDLDAQTGLVGDREHVGVFWVVQEGHLCFVRGAYVEDGSASLLVSCEDDDPNTPTATGMILTDAQGAVVRGYTSPGPAANDANYDTESFGGLMGALVLGA